MPVRADRGKGRKRMCGLCAEVDGWRQTRGPALSLPDGVVEGGEVAGEVGAEMDGDGLVGLLSGKSCRSDEVSLVRAALSRGALADLKTVNACKR